MRPDDLLLLEHEPDTGSTSLNHNSDMLGPGESHRQIHIH